MVPNRIIKALFIILLLGLPIYLAGSMYRLDKAYFICPIEYPWDVMIRCDSMGDGTFAAPRNGNRMHNGIDLLAQVGTPVLACRAGQAKVFWQKNGMGRYIEVYHNGGFSTLYGHLSAIEINNGDLVRQGQEIGRVGKTGEF